MYQFEAHIQRRFNGMKKTNVLKLALTGLIMGSVMTGCSN